MFDSGPLDAVLFDGVLGATTPPPLALVLASELTAVLLDNDADDFEVDPERTQLTA